MSESFLRRLWLDNDVAMTVSMAMAMAMTLLPANADGDDDNNTNNDADGDTDVAAPPDIFVSQACLLIPVFVAAWWYYTKHWCRALVKGVLKNNPEEESTSNDNSAHPTSSGRFARMEEAYFQSAWGNDVGSASEKASMDGTTAASSPSNRFVKWINRGNVRRRYEVETMKRTTRGHLFGKRQRNSSNTHNNNNNKAQNDKSSTGRHDSDYTLDDCKAVLSDKSLLDTFDDEDTNGSSDGAKGYPQQQQSISKGSPRSSNGNSFDQWECIPEDSHIELCAIPNGLHDDGLSVR